MNRPLFRAFCWFTVVALVGAGLLSTGCPSAPPVAPGPQQIEDEFFIGNESPAQSIAVGGKIDLAGGGTITLPQGSPSGVEVTVADGALNPLASQRFLEWNPDISLAGMVHKITVQPEAQAPQYLIVRLPAPDPTARIFVSGYIDADTSDLDWTPVFGTYDPQTGLVTAAV